MQVNVASNSKSLLDNVQRHLPITAGAFSIPEDIMSHTANNIKAEELLNKDRSTASSEPNTRTVKKFLQSETAYSST